MLKGILLEDNQVGSYGNFLFKIQQIICRLHISICVGNLLVVSLVYQPIIVFVFLALVSTFVNFTDVEKWI